MTAGRRSTLVVGVALLDDPDAPGRLLAARRTHPPQVAGLWEFPGGKVEPGETVLEAGVREVREELGVDVRVLAELPGPLDHPDVPAGVWPLGGDLVMAVLVAVPVGNAEAAARVHDALRWLTRDQLDTVAWVPADRPVADAVATRLRGRRPGP